MREEKPKGTKCYGINGLLTEGDELAGEIGDEAVLDAAIIASAQAVEHYEITRYGALIAWAREMSRNDFADILEENLEEEKGADAKLNKIAEGRVNAKASGKASSPPRRQRSNMRTAPRRRTSQSKAA
jgi:ferritin-like metal-binding protein YciE